MTNILFEGGTGTPAQSTVLITLFNYGRYLDECLDSVASQEVEALHLVVVDDCSTDDSTSVARGWISKHASRFGRVVLAGHEANRGLAAARNTAVSLAESDLVLVLDADNMLFPHCVSRLQAALDVTTAAFAYGYHQLFDEARGLGNVAPWSADLSHGNHVDAMVLIRRSIVQHAGGYSAMPVMGWEDFDLWFKLARLGQWGVLVPEIVARYRVHGQSMLRTLTNPNSDRLWTYLRSTYPEFFDSAAHFRLFNPITASRALRRENAEPASSSLAALP